MPEEPASALLMVRHTTRLDYASSVVDAHSEVRKTPVDSGLQRVLTSKVEVEPPARLRSRIDYFGSRVHHFNLLEAHRWLRVSAESLVETRAGFACGHEAPPDRRPWPQRWAEFLHPSPRVPELPAYAEVSHGVRVLLPAEEFLAALRALAAAFAARFRYDPGATDVHATAARLFEAGGGVCQDFAHGLIGVLRRAGVPARYASGYVYEEPPPAARAPARPAAASHAWVQAWHPELGWVGVDPTHDGLVDWRYVRIGVGRDYGDVEPLRGVFVGAREQRLSVEVTVTRLG